jgi:hypothetical protein
MASFTFKDFPIKNPARKISAAAVNIKAKTIGNATLGRNSPSAPSRVRASLPQEQVMESSAGKFIDSGISLPNLSSN